MEMIKSIFTLISSLHLAPIIWWSITKTKITIKFDVNVFFDVEGNYVQMHVLTFEKRMEKESFTFISGSQSFCGNNG